MTQAITVIICTHQRAASLKRTIDSLLPQIIPFSGDEVLVLDNGPSQEVARHFAKAYSRNKSIRFIGEPVVGLSIARNTGLANINTPLVAYIDDDVIVGKDWLAAAKSAIKVGSPKLAAVAGRVQLSLPYDAPDWLHPKMEAYLGKLDLGDKQRNLHASESFVGCNMLFRRDLLQKVGGFPTSLGRKGDSSLLLSNEELAVRKKFLEAGHGITYSPQMSLTHVVSKERLTKNWFRNRFLSQALSDCALGGIYLLQRQVRAAFRRPILLALSKMLEMTKIASPAVSFYFELEALYDRALLAKHNVTSVREHL